LSKLCLFCFWLLVGIYFYNYLLRGNSKNKVIILNKINSLSYLELTLLLFCIFYTLLSLEHFILNYYLNNNIKLDSFLYFLGQEGSNSTGIEATTSQMVENNSPIIQSSSNNNPQPQGSNISITVNQTNTPNIESSTTSNANGNTTRVRTAYVRSSTSEIGNSAIMGVGVSTAIKIAASAQTPLGKAAILGGGVAAAALGIAAKEAIEQARDEIAKKNNFLPDNINYEEIINKALDLSGNTGLDLLIFIQIFQKLQLLFLFIVIYNLLFTLIDLNKAEVQLLKVFPLHIVNYLIKYLKLLKKSSRFVIVLSLLLLLFCNYGSYYIITFYIDNISKIIELYFK